MRMSDKSSVFKIMLPAEADTFERKCAEDRQAPTSYIIAYFKSTWYLQNALVNRR
jgi:hypothetical protein